MSQKSLFSVVFLCMALVFTGCAAMGKTGLWKKPEVKFSNARIAAFNSEGMTLDLDLDIFNPNGYGISYGAMEYRLNVQEKDFLSGKLAQSGSLKAKETQKVTFPVVFKFADLLVLAKNISGDALPYALDATIPFDIPMVGEVKIPIKHKGTFPMPQIPGIPITGFDIEKLPWLTPK